MAKCGEMSENANITEEISSKLKILIFLNDGDGFRNSITKRPEHGNIFT